MPRKLDSVQARFEEPIGGRVLGLIPDSIGPIVVAPDQAGHVKEPAQDDEYEYECDDGEYGRK